MNPKVMWSSLESNQNRAVVFYLAASYLYYIKDESLLPDMDYDLLCNFLNRNWDSIQHRHKHLISREGLVAGSGFYLKEEDYPLILVSVANKMMNGEI